MSTAWFLLWVTVMGGGSRWQAGGKEERCWDSDTVSLDKGALSFGSVSTNKVFRTAFSSSAVRQVTAAEPWRFRHGQAKFAKHYESCYFVNLSGVFLLRGVKIQFQLSHPLNISQQKIKLSWQTKSFEFCLYLSAFLENLFCTALKNILLKIFTNILCGLTHKYKSVSHIYLLVVAKLNRRLRSHASFDLWPLFVPAPSAPSFIHFSELTTTSVNVSWGDPTFPNGIIEGYRLVYEPSTPVDGKLSFLPVILFSAQNGCWLL